MTPQSCSGCDHYRASLIYKMACYRSKTFKSGRIVHATPDAGFAAEFETHKSPSIYEGRADGDTCGADRIHWEAE